MPTLDTTPRQRGVVLIVALVLLVVLTLIAATSSKLALNDERGGRAARDYRLAFEAAEATLRNAESEIITGSRKQRFDGNTIAGFAVGCPEVPLPSASLIAASVRGLCLPDEESPQPLWTQVSFDARGVPFGTFTGQRWAGPGAAPLYLIEARRDETPGVAIGGPSRPNSARLYYRITAVAKSPTGRHVVALQSAFRP
ncbi:MAG: PilX N-terminal domain-containing pilus assembly protein [Burkholderiaceae bacterium]